MQNEVYLLWRRLFTVLYFSVRSSRSSALCYGLPSYMRHECQNYLGGGGGLGGPSIPPPPPRAKLPDARPLHLKIKIPVTVRRGVSRRSQQKIGDCEQFYLWLIFRLCLDFMCCFAFAFLLRWRHWIFFDHLIQFFSV